MRSLPLRILFAIGRGVSYLLPFGISPLALNLRLDMRSLGYEVGRLQMHLEWAKRDEIDYKREIASLRKEKQDLQDRYWKERDKYWDSSSLKSENQLLRSELRVLEFQINLLQQGGGSVIPHFHLSPSAPKPLFDAVYKALAKMYHTDKNSGSGEKIKQINNLRDEIYKTKGWS
jgi:hypothetical protein